jgi:hypothetical protein
MTVVDAALGERVFADLYDHLSAELEWLDLSLARGVLGMRSAVPADAPTPGLHISDQEAELLLAPRPPADQASELSAEVTALRAHIDARVTRTLAAGVDLRLPALADRLGLSAFERQALLLCLAPELDRKYDRLYAYLQDDITRKRPSVDLVLAVLVPDPPDRWWALRRFSAHAPLRRSGLLEVVVDAYSPSGSSALARMLRVAPRFAAHLLGDDHLDDGLAGMARLVEAGPRPPEPQPVAVKALACLLDRHRERGNDALVVHLQGSDAAESVRLAHVVAAGRGGPTVELDVTAASTAEALDAAVTATLRESWLLETPAVLVAADRLCAEEQPNVGLDDALARYPGPVLVVTGGPWPATRRPRTTPVHEVDLPQADLPTRLAAWTAVLSGPGVAPGSAADDLAHELAARFRLGIGQIEVAAGHVVRGPDPAAATRAEWYAACRRASGQGLAAVAERVAPTHGWDDLVLDDHRRATLRALRDQVALRERVLDEWGLGDRITGSRGLAALFAGPPGTGKTMAATVVAADLGLDLYRVDLSRVVSKYIGETEKNLSRIFAEADGANAVLMFDEADALFGKRTEVSDAHDRYANIEVSYLLQRMEQYEGVAILASNLRQNMDDAFLRRLRFVVDFPFPEPAQRLLIWQAHLRTGAPLHPDLDVAVLAERLVVSGGTIRNIVLSASFLAAADDAPVGMDHLVRAARREFAKTDAVWPASAFPASRRQGSASG